MTPDEPVGDSLHLRLDSYLARAEAAEARVEDWRKAAADVLAFEEPDSLLDQEFDPKLRFEKTMAQDRLRALLNPSSSAAHAHAAIEHDTFTSMCSCEAIRYNGRWYEPAAAAREGNADPPISTAEEDDK